MTGGVPTGCGPERARDWEGLPLLGVLRALPPGQQLVWGDTHLRLTDDVWRASWIDVQVPELCAALGWNWVWTIVTPDDGDAPLPGELSTTIPLEPDCDVHTVVDPKTGWYSTTGPVFVTAPGKKLTRKQLSTLARAGEPVVASGWTQRAVRGALADWCAEHAGRGDLNFVFDDSVGVESLHRSASYPPDSGTPDDALSYQIGEGMFVTDKVMDVLLSLPPEEAAQLVEGLTEAIRRHRSLENP